MSRLDMAEETIIECGNNHQKPSEIKCKEKKDERERNRMENPKHYRHVHYARVPRTPEGKKNGTKMLKRIMTEIFSQASARASQRSRRL
jgi:hypothetical protein